MGLLASLRHRIFGSPPRPPTIEFDDAGFSLTHTGELNSAMSWDDLSEVWVALAGGEAWWSLRSPQNTMIVPTSLVAGGDEFAERVRALPRFNEEAFLAAKRAEANDERDDDEFQCWSRSTA